VWAEDEHRLGLKPVLRRVWAPKGERPRAVVKERYEWLYQYGFVEPHSGETFWVILPVVNSEAFSLALEEFAEWVGVGDGKQVLVVLDQAGWHVGRRVRIPEGVHLVELPSKSPELQPAERLWPLTNEAVCNRAFGNLDELEEVLVDRCMKLAEMQDDVRSSTLYHWWPLAS
jgi:hypothetical protein